MYPAHTGQYLSNSRLRKCFWCSLERWSNLQIVSGGQALETIWSLFLIILFVANYQQNQDPRESKYADSLEFWKIHSNIYQLLIDLLIALMNLQDWCSKWNISINSMKTTCMVFCDKKNISGAIPFYLVIFLTIFPTLVLI